MSISLIETFKNNYRLELDNVNIKDMAHGGKQYTGGY